MAKKKTAKEPEVELTVHIVDPDAQEALRKALNGDGRTRQVVDLTRRALTLRANGATDDEIAKTERVETSTLTQWMASPRRAPSAEEAQRMITEEIKPLAIENTLHQVLAGDRAATRQAMKDTGVMKPPKATSHNVKIIVGVGQSPIGNDPVRVAIALQIGK